VLGVLLVGIVGMRVEVLKLGSTVGTEMQQASVLQSANAVMQKQVSALSDNQRIEQLAEKRGMVMPLPLDLHFVHASGPANVSKAIADIREPSPTTFLAGLTNERVNDGASVVAAEQTSAIGVLGGGAISDGTSSSSTSSTTDPTGATDTTTADTTTADTTTADTSSADTGATDATTAGSSTQTQTSGATDGTQGTVSSTPGSSDPGSSDSGDPTNSAPPVTNSDSNGASSLAG
jgi:cell division protein FtsL